MTADIKPYPAYKDSGIPWLGKVPKHWELKRGKWLFRHRKEINADHTHTNILSLTLRGVVNNDPDDPEGLVPKDYATYQFFAKGDLVFKLIDLENLRTSRVGLVHEDGIMSSAYVRLVPRHSGVQHFFYHQYFDLYQRGIFNQLGAGVRSTLGPSDLLNVGILVPSADEQSAIVRFLDYMDRRIRRYIRTKKKLIELLNKQKQAIIHRAVTRGLNPSARLKPSGVEWLGDVPEHWTLARLKDSAVVQTGLTLGKNYRVPTETRPYLRVANVQHGRLDLRLVKHIDVPPSEAAGATLKSGDVLMTEGGDIDKLGRGCMWRNEIPGCLHQNHIFAVRCRQDVLVPEFLVGLMISQHGRAYFQLTAKQTTNLASTNSTTLRAFPIILPPVAVAKGLQYFILCRDADALNTLGIGGNHHGLKTTGREQIGQRVAVPAGLVMLAIVSLATEQ